MIRCNHTSSYMVVYFPCNHKGSCKVKLIPSMIKSSSVVGQNYSLLDKTVVYTAQNVLYGGLCRTTSAIFHQNFSTLSFLVLVHANII